MAVNGSTTPCAWTINTDCVSGWDDLDPSLQAAATAYGSLVMWALTGRRFGLCTVIARPCGVVCGGGAFGSFWDDGGWAPYILDGEWFNCGCGGGCCAPTCQVYLDGPVDSVTSVVMDGVVVNPASYRVDDSHWLVRTDGLCWPSGQNYDVDSGVGTLLVTYLRGDPVPPAVLGAAGILAGEWVKACLGQACAMPSHITSIARSGVTVAVHDLDTLIRNRLTGIAVVDQIIVAVNPHKATHRPRLLSPELMGTRVVTSP
jgi:hypothetical protein